MAWNPYMYPALYSQQIVGRPAGGDLTSVTGIEGARAYPLPPNSRAALFDENQDLLYIKSTDGAGFPTVRTYRFEEVEPEVPSVPAAPDYVSRDEFEELMRKVESMAARHNRRGARNDEQPVPETKRG